MDILMGMLDDKKINTRKERENWLQEIETFVEEVVEDTTLDQSMRKRIKEKFDGIEINLGKAL